MGEIACGGRAKNRGDRQKIGELCPKVGKNRRFGSLSREAAEPGAPVGAGAKMLARGVAGAVGLISECARMRVPTGRLRIVSTQPAEVGEVHEGPPSPGRYIREARQRRGMSIEQLALDTKIPRASLEALEEDRFSALPGPVFVRG
ncbi:MAG TPA: helix-turn-helix domain-containing protein, partial [Nannocystis sp.]